MKRIWLITGRPGAGKTTILVKVTERLGREGYKIGGIVTREIREKGVRVGFEIGDCISGRKGLLAHVRQPVGPRVGRYRVNLEQLDSVGVSAIANALREAGIVVIDEIGPMELMSKAFKRVVLRAISSTKLVLATIHHRTQHYLTVELRSRGMDMEVFEATEETRDALPVLIANRIAQSGMRQA